MEREEILATLRDLPERVDAACEALGDEQLRRRPSAGEWSLLEVLCHLRDAAEIEGTRIRRLVEEDEPLLEPYDQEALARDRNYAGDDPRRVRTALRAFWGGLAYQLEHLSDDQWQRAGTHPERGRVTVASRAELNAEHAQEHMAQLRELMERS